MCDCFVSEPNWTSVPQRLLETITEEDGTDSSVPIQGSAFIFHKAHVLVLKKCCLLHRNAYVRYIAFPFRKNGGHFVRQPYLVLLPSQSRYEVSLYSYT